MTPPATTTGAPATGVPVGPTTSTTFVTPGLVTTPTTLPDSTASTLIKLTTTDSKGNLVTTAPSAFTTAIPTTSNGVVYTVTQVVHNPSGSLDQGSSGGSSSSFFNNHGAVAGVFVVVGLAVVAILGALGLLFYRRRRRQRIDREVTAAAAAASAAASRSPLDEVDDVHSSHPTSESYPSTMSQPMTQYNQYAATYGNAGGYDPFALEGATTGAAAYGGYQAGEHMGQQQQHYGSAEDHQGYYYDHDSGGHHYDPVDAHYNDHVSPPPTGQPLYGRYEDDPYGHGAYSGGEGSIDTPLERPDPLHVTNPSHGPNFGRP